MKLDDKLREILSAYSDIDGDELGEDKFIGTHDKSKAIAQLKQAFADEAGFGGSVTIIKSYEMSNGKDLLSGQEWYERFVQELDLPEGMPPFLERLSEITLEAAKRASGVEE